MKDERKTKRDLIEELHLLRHRIEELEQPGGRLKKMEEHLRREIEWKVFLLELYEKSFLMPDRELYGYVLDEILRLTGSSIGFFHLVSDDQKDVILTMWNSEALNNCTAAYDTHYPIEKAGNWVDCVRLKRAVVYNDFPASPNRRGLPEGHTPIRRFMSIPVVEENKVRFIFGVGNKEGEYGEYDVTQIQLAANDLQRIVRQRRSEDALRRLSRAVEQSPALIIITDTSGNIEYVNPKFTQLTGYTREEAMGQNPRMLKSGRTPPAEYSRLWATITAGNEWHGEFCNRKKNGDLYWEDASISPIFDDKGVIVSFLAVKEDITERKLMEEELRRSESTIRALFDATLEAIFLVDSGGRVLAVNDAGARRFRKTAQEIIGSNAFDLLPPELVPSRRNRFLEVIRSGKPLRFEDRRGSAWLDNHFYPVMDKAGTVTGVALYSRDISERKQAEEALRASEEKYRAIFNSAMEGIYQSTPEGRYLSVNAAMARMLGYDSPEDLISGITDIARQIYINPQDRDLLKEMLARHGSVNNFETRCYRKDGTAIWIEFSARVVYSPDGSISHYEGIMEDITGRKEAEAQIRRLNEELEHRVSERTAELQVARQEIENISFSISHDLRTPLRAMDGFSRILQTEYGLQLPDEANRYLEIMRSNAQFMGMLMDRLSDFLSISRRSIRKSIVSMQDIAGASLAGFASETEERNIQATIGEMPACEADPVMMKIVFSNLISNAVKFIDRTRSTLIEIGSYAKRGEVIFFVKDNGVGFDMKYIDKVFGAFQRLHKQDEFQGAGLGLAITQNIIRRHGGRIWAESAPAKGTTIFFTVTGS